MYYQTLYQSKRNRFKQWIGETRLFPYIAILLFIFLVSGWIILLCL